MNMCNKNNKIISTLSFSLLAFMVSANINIINVSAKTTLEELKQGDSSVLIDELKEKESSVSLEKIEATKNKWLYKDNAWYCLDSSGKTQTGWITNDPSGFKYRLDGDGKMQIGWHHIEDSWYYFDVNTGAMKTGWLQDNNNWYYFNEDGTMAVDTIIEGYRVNANGLWIH